MCGIAGKLYFHPERRVERDVLAAMNRALAHRGPDDEGVWADGPVGFAHRRLSIVDLTAAGHQPMANEAGTLWITFNGEIYNFPELRAELEARGVKFRSRSDTEVLLALWEQEGSACLTRLKGMFAFGLWDARRRVLVLARDRAGKKPLHYYVDHEKALFASEPKGVHADPSVRADADVVAIHHYLTYGYVPAPQSAFHGFAKVPPGHYVEIRADGRVSVTRYWRLAFRRKLAIGEDEACALLLDRLRAAVRRRLIADVPIGVFLSGGVDSSAVVALMAELGERPVKTFSMGFEDDAYNELPWARQIAERYGTEHHEFVVKHDAAAILPELVWHYNEPFADSSAIATYHLSALARPHVTVALNGDGGDENFAGYERYWLNVLAMHWDRLPGPVRRVTDLGVRIMPDGREAQSLRARIHRFWGDRSLETRRRYGRWMMVVPDRAKVDLYTRDFREATREVDTCDVILRAYAMTDTPDLVDASLGVDIATYLPDDLLFKMDIASMAHGLETRSPMVDHEFMEFAASLPSSLKLYRGGKKHIFKRALRDFVPAAILARPKQGFGVPILDWLRGPLRDMLHDTLLGRASRERGLFDTRATERLVDEHDRGVAEHHPQLWALLMLELWFERFIDAPRSSARLAS